jgi:hypothetical protein
LLPRYDVHVRLVLAILLHAACGGARPKTTDAAPSCEAVAEHLIELAEHDNAAPAGSDLGAGMRGELTRQCREVPWSPARRRCLHAAPVQEATLDCS